MSAPNFEFWTRRWWKTPGETLWEDDIDGARWQAIFHSDINAWNLRVVNMTTLGETTQLCWTYQEQSLSLTYRTRSCPSTRRLPTNERNRRGDRRFTASYAY
jgi:hypothetical protein